MKHLTKDFLISLFKDEEKLNFKHKVILNDTHSTASTSSGLTDGENGDVLRSI